MAESLKYSNRVAIILPLGGKLALFNNQRKLVGWFTSWESLVLAIQSIESTIERAPSRRVSLSLEDLGLI